MSKDKSKLKERYKIGYIRHFYNVGMLPFVKIVPIRLTGRKRIFTLDGKSHTDVEYKWFFINRWIDENRLVNYESILHE